MAGHSKWANIRFRKGAQDVKRGKIFTRFIREITVAARTGGGDLATNPRLRGIVDKALAQNMPKDNIERAIKRGTGEIAGAHYEEVRYEGYAPGGVAVLVECTTDNRHRTAGEVRHGFAKHGGNLGTDGSVAYLFRKLAVFTFPAGTKEGELLDAALEAGAEDLLETGDGGLELLAPPEALEGVRAAVKARGFTPLDAEVLFRPTTSVQLEGEDAERTLKLLEALEELDDVQYVHTNAEFPEELMAASRS